MFSTPAPIRARVRPNSWLRIRPRLWRTIVVDLGQRGHGTRESGAFLLAQPAARTTIVDWVAYDDLDPGCLTGGISFAGEGIGRLSDHCAATGLVVAGDVHTHPGSFVAQSHIDRDNPMIAKKGHVALILPDYAQTSPLPTEIGIHRYLGGRHWDSRLAVEAAAALYLGWFA
jgi:hypothetical protein